LSFVRLPTISDDDATTSRVGLCAGAELSALPTAGIGSGAERGALAPVVLFFGEALVFSESGGCELDPVARELESDWDAGCCPSKASTGANKKRSRNGINLRSIFL
jgi:hypothetical protein